MVETLRSRGVRFAIDDFGTGYNSLATLRSNTVDTLKLDMCFVAGIATSPVDQAIASAVITAAHGSGATVVAEGVETPAQRAMLATLDCDAAQGFLFGGRCRRSSSASCCSPHRIRRPPPDRNGARCAASAQRRNLGGVHEVGKA